MPTINDRFKMRRGSAADLAAVNEVPLKGEWIWEEDQGLDDGKYKLKIGDGVTHYNDLEYLASGGGIEDVTAGSHIVIDKSNPANPVIGVSGLTVSSSYAEGTSFPTSPAPAVDDKFYRTDLNLLCYYDGARWLTATLYIVPGINSDFLMAGSTSTNPVLRWSTNGNAIYIDRLEMTTYVIATNTGSAYWIFALNARDASNTNTSLGSISTQGNAPNNWVGHTLSIGALVPAGTFEIQTSSSRTGNPGGSYFVSNLFYRLVID